MPSPGVALVTGGTGFIGSHLVERLLEDDWVVHVAARPGSAGERLRPYQDRITFHRGSIGETRFARKVIDASRPTIVFHLANRTDLRHAGAEVRSSIESVNVGLLGTLHLIEAAEEYQVQRLIRLGGLEEYGGGAGAVEEQRERPVSPYSAGQVAATHYGQMLQRHMACTLVTLRPALVYGPGQGVDFFIPALIHACLRGHDFRLSPGDPWRDLLYVTDLIEAMRRTVYAPRLSGEVINLGSGREYRMADVAERIIRKTGASIRLVASDECGGPPELLHLSGRIVRAADLLGWRPATTLEEGLRRTVAWYRTEHESGS